MFYVLLNVCFDDKRSDLFQIPQFVAKYNPQAHLPFT